MKSFKKTIVSLLAFIMVITASAGTFVLADEVDTEEPTADEVVIEEEVEAEPEAGGNDPLDIALDAAHFPDDVLRAYLATVKFDQDLDGYLSDTEREAITELDLSSSMVSDLTGLNYLFSLCTLNCDNSEITQIKLSSLGLTSISFSNCANLVSVDVGRNQITSLCVENCPNLEALDCGDNYTITNLYINNCPKLKVLECNDNLLTELDLSNCPTLEFLAAEGNPGLEYIDIMDCPQLCFLYDSVAPITRPFHDYMYYAHKLDDNHNFRYNTDCVIITTPVESFISRIYVNVLMRSFDQDGINFWADQITSGTMTAGDVAHFFFFGEEFQATVLNNASFINPLYAVFFNRTADRDGFNFWDGEMNNGKTQEEVFESFLNTQEWANVCAKYGLDSGINIQPEVPSYAIKSFVTRLYTCMLRRGGESGGITYWTNQLFAGKVTGTDVALLFYTGEEFNRGAELEDVVFVARLYQTFFDRTPDDDELTYWVGEIGNGMPRDLVFDCFTASAEWANLCDAAGIRPI